MIIDCHAHIGRNHHINSSVDDLLKSMDEAGIDKSFVFAGELNDAPNDWVLEQVAPYLDRLSMVAAYNLGEPKNVLPFWQRDKAKYLSELYVNKQIVAVKFYTGYDHYFPTDVSRVLKSLEEVGCPAIFHCGDCLNSVKKAKLKYSNPLHIDDVAVDFPNMNFIIAHMGFPFVRETAEVCYKNDNVYTDISGFVYGKFDENDFNKFEKVIQEFLDITNSDKLLFGTDFPISNQESYINTISKLSLSVEYLSNNIKRAFKLNV